MNKGSVPLTLYLVYNHQSYTCTYFSEGELAHDRAGLARVPRLVILEPQPKNQPCFSEYSVNKGPTLSHYTSYMTKEVIPASQSTLWIKDPPLSHYTSYMTIKVIPASQSTLWIKDPPLSHYTAYMTIKVILASLSTLWIKDPSLLHYTSYRTIKVIPASLSTLWIKDPPSHTIPHIWPSKLYLLLWVLCE